MRFVPVLVFVLLGASFIRASAPTFDESAHLAAGHGCLVHGPRCLNYEGHPPFPDKWAALPLLALKPAGFFDGQEWINGRLYNYADQFLYKNTVPAETLLNTSRLWVLLTWSIALAYPLLEWSRSLGGTPALWAAGALFAFCPVLISNFSLVTTDAASTTLYFITFWLLSSRRFLAAGIAIGLALASKYNMPYLPAVAALCLALERKKVPAAALAQAAAAAAFLFAACYGFADLRQYWLGLKTTIGWMREGWASFLFGDITTSGHLLYFPAALAIKTPIPLLIMAAAGVRRLRLVWLIVPPVAYFAATGFSKMQLGVRHVMPVLPFMIVWGAQGAAWAWKRSPKTVVVLGAWLAVSVLSVHPDYLSYFNELVGGPANGYRCLVDSNLDWGQGLKELSVELARRGNPPVVLSYFGNADPVYYGIRHIPLAGMSLVDRLRAPRSGVEELLDPILLAVSVTNLQGVYFKDKTVFAWLKERAPVFVAGHSIFLYDLTHDPEGVRRLAALLAGGGYPKLSRRLAARFAN